jgi:hypothetical protein
LSFSSDSLLYISILISFNLCLENVGKYVNAQSVRDVYGGNANVTLVCNGGQYITGDLLRQFSGSFTSSSNHKISFLLSLLSIYYSSELYTCWSQVNGTVIERCSCPPDVQKEDTCKSTDIYIQAFGTTPPPVMQPSVAPYAAIVNPGDICIIGFNSLNPDEVVLVALVDIPSGFTVYVTDNGWTGTSFRTGEGDLTCTFGSGLKAGVVFSASSTSCKLSGSFDLSTNGEQVILLHIHIHIHILISYSDCSTCYYLYIQDTALCWIVLYS